MPSEGVINPASVQLPYIDVLTTSHFYGNCMLVGTFFWEHMEEVMLVFTFFWDQMEDVIHSLSQLLNQSINQSINQSLSPYFIPVCYHGLPTPHINEYRDVTESVRSTLSNNLTYF